MPGAPAARHRTPVPLPSPNARPGSVFGGSCARPTKITQSRPGMPGCVLLAAQPVRASHRKRTSVPFSGEKPMRDMSSV